MGENKPVFLEIDSELWRNAKIQAIKEAIDLRDWVANAIQEKLAHSNSNQNNGG